MTNIHAQYFKNNQSQIWLLDELRTVGPRWCVIEVDGTMLSIENGGRKPVLVDLRIPDSVDKLAAKLKMAFETTTLFATAE